MNVPRELEADRRWRLAVWTLRVGYVALVVAFVGLILAARGTTGWVLAIGVIWWLTCVVITLPSFLLARHRLGPDRPELWPMRMMLIYDSVHALQR